MLKNEVRIIGGFWRGRKLKFVDTEHLRPTPNRIRETLFNWLSSVIRGAYCLDLFAGSGALGFEALSRGANQVVFVDQNETVIQQLKANQNRLQCDNMTVYQGNAETYLTQTKQTFDIVFLDPPFQKDLITPICHLLAEKERLNPKAFVYIETEYKKKENSPTFGYPPDWKIIKQNHYGQVAFYLIKRP